MSVTDLVTSDGTYSDEGRLKCYAPVRGYQCVSVVSQQVKTYHQTNGKDAVETKVGQRQCVTE